MYYGLLAPEDKQQAVYQGLMGLGSGLLQGSAPSSTPKGLLGGIGQGLQGFQQGMQGYAGAMQKNKMAQVQMADLEAKRKRQADMDANRAKLMMTDPLKLSDSSSLPLIMGASDDPVAAYFGFRKANQPTGPQSSLAKLEADYRANLIPESVYKAALAKETTSQPLVNVGSDKLETEEAKRIGAGYGDRYNKLLGEAEAARSNLSTLAQIEPLLSQVSTGTGAGAGMAVKSFMKRINVDPTTLGLRDDVAPAEAMQSLGNQLVLKLRTSEGMPASGFSDADRDFLFNIPPNITNTFEGNKFIASLLRKKSEYIMRRAWDAQQYFEKNGTYRGFEAANPSPRLFSDEDVSKAVELSQSAMVVVPDDPPPQNNGAGTGAGGSVLTPDIAKQKSSDELRSVLGN